MKTLTRLAIAIAMAAGATLTAQDVRFGLQVHGNVPLGDLKDAVDSKPGFGGGAHLAWNLGGGHMLRPRIDYIFFPENSSYVASGYGVSASGKYKLDDLSGGVDYLYFLDGKDDGFYLTVGASWNRWKVDYKYTVTVGSEVRYTSTKFGKGDGSANAVQVGVTLRF
jgi:hypothetical protein